MFLSGASSQPVQREQTTRKPSMIVPHMEPDADQHGGPSDHDADDKKMPKSMKLAYKGKGKKAGK